MRAPFTKWTGGFAKGSACVGTGFRSSGGKRVAIIGSDVD
jgi:hypothetical protein